LPPGKPKRRISPYCIGNLKCARQDALKSLTSGQYTIRLTFGFSGTILLLSGENPHVSRICSGRGIGISNTSCLENIKEICSDCGKIIPDSDTVLFADCKQIRRQKAKEWLITAERVVDAAAGAEENDYGVIMFK